jgi:predicted O-linked N-acetylglucosamine transferase (SPINDLY family)
MEITRYSDIPQVLSLAVAHHEAGRLTEARGLYQQVLALDQGHAEALRMLGIVLMQTGQLHRSIELIRQSITARPTAIAYVNLGNALNAGNDADGAIAAYHEAIRLTPNYPQAYYNLGIALADKGASDDAIAAQRNALRLKPDYPAALNNLGVLLNDKGKSDEAVACYRKAIQLDPQYAEAHTNLGNALKDQGLIEQALASFDRAIELKPADPVLHSNRVLALAYDPRADTAMILREQQLWDQRHGRPLLPEKLAHDNDPSPDRRLRIGYVSPDFRIHILGFNILPLIEAHDRDRFGVFCYCDNRRSDRITDRFRARAEGWRMIAGMSDAEIAEQIRRDRIDILVDLTMHMARNRLPVFARKPAPVQVTFAGYPGGTGLSAIDYRLTDPYLDPPGTDSDYVEKTIRLPDTFWCYDPAVMHVGDAPDPEMNPLPALERGFVTFGCLNNFCKVNDQALSLWSAVLNCVSRSRLVLLGREGSLRGRTLERFSGQGVDPSRIQFVSNVPRPQYLEFYHGIDIGLDALPYNGHTTSLDSFWMGVPLVTCAGKTIVGRAGLSQLSNLGLAELAGWNGQQFVKIAIDLAGDLPRLAELRADLRERMRRSRLMDVPRFARSIEAAYREMWRRWCASRRD